MQPFLSLFPSEMIAKLETTPITAQQSKDQIKQTKGATILINQQQHTHRLRTLSRSYWGLKLILLAKSSP